MQNIQINLEDERGNIIESSNINFAEIVEVLRNYGTEQEYPWLWTIDPYGNTIFNVHQVPKATEELNSLSLKIKDNKMSGKTNEVINFMKKIEQHLYIKFIGD